VTRHVICNASPPYNWARIQALMESSWYTSIAIAAEKMASVLVVGTNQGIGLGIVEQLLKSEEVGQVFATVRDPASSSCDDINKLAASNPKLHIIKLLLDPKSAQVYAIAYLLLMCRRPLPKLANYSMGRVLIF